MHTKKLLAFVSVVANNVCMSTETQPTNIVMMSMSSDKFYQASTGCYVDSAAARRMEIDMPKLRKLADAYRMGWLHNVLSRITPLTLQRRDDYIAMADLFIETAESAEHVLDRFDADLELFCSVAEIQVTPHMTMHSVSDELSAHTSLYQEIAEVFYRKFDIEHRDPIRNLTLSPIMSEHSNPFIKEFMDSRFKRKDEK